MDTWWCHCWQEELFGWWAEVLWCKKLISSFVRTISVKKDSMFISLNWTCFCLSLNVQNANDDRWILPWPIRQAKVSERQTVFSHYRSSMRSIDIADVALDIPSRQLIDRQVRRERRVRRLTTINTSILCLVLASKNAQEKMRIIDSMCVFGWFTYQHHAYRDK